MLMFSGQAYGLGIRSELDLPELVAKDVPADISVCLGKVDCLSEGLTDGQTHGLLSVSQDEACYFYKDAGKYLVRSGREIIVEPISGADPVVVRLSLLGPAMALALMQRGTFVLHASAVAFQGSRAVAFLGGHAWGKSTLAAMLHLRGHRMLTDDVAAIGLPDDSSDPDAAASGAKLEATVIPSFPQVKLWPDAASSLGKDAESLPRVHPRVPKVAVAVTEGFSGSPVPLERIYVLGKGPCVEIESLTRQNALGELMAHWYGSRFGPAMLQAIGTSSFFLRCATLVNAVPTQRLRRPASESPGDPALAAAIEDLIVRDLA